MIIEFFRSALSRGGWGGKKRSGKLGPKE